jgi:hypothetical protein
MLATLLATTLLLTPEAAVTSNYVYRGRTLSEQGSSLRASLAASTGPLDAKVSIQEVSFFGEKTDLEVLSLVSYTKEAYGLEFQVGDQYRYYPWDNGQKKSYNQVFASVAKEVGPLEVKYFTSYSGQEFNSSLKSSGETLYNEVSANLKVTKNLSLRASYAHNDSEAQNYNLWDASATYRYKGLDFSLSYVDTQGLQTEKSYTYFTVSKSF